jgi:hypothetical protein
MGVDENVLAVGFVKNHAGSIDRLFFLDHGLLSITLLDI